MGKQISIDDFSELSIESSLKHIENYVLWNGINTDSIVNACISALDI